MRRMATDAPDRLSVLLDCWLMVTEIARSALERITGTNLLIPGPLASFFLPYMLPYKKKKMLVLWAFRGRRPITGIPACCARAASGDAAPPSSVLKSRRFMSSMGTSSPMRS